ncbi:MAG: hypothetical protein EOO52_10160 [Gammaproteobacteria bacterium]|nr:MAG: hypothetical protein EOO52_10160 [Gammaproteobacteria bacterium]
MFLKQVSKKIQISLFATISLSISLNCFSDSKVPWAEPVPHKIEYKCGSKCFSIDEVIFEFNANKDFVNDEDKLSSKMSPFKARFEKEMKDLKTAHKIKINSFFRLDNSFPSFKSEESVLKVQVSMTKDKCDPLHIKLEVVSLSAGEIGFQKMECRDNDKKCVDEKLSLAFEKYVLGYIKEYVPPTSIE